ncbi:hypothetical protein LLH00_09950 [bacterium]|nr:hypothetical protein [bacterium]
MKKNHLTIIFMKDTRQPVTLEVSIKLLILIVVLLLGSASTYAFFIRGYLTLNSDNQKLELIIRSLKTDIGRLQNTINRMNTEDETASSAQSAAAQTQEAPPDENVAATPENIAVENLNLNYDSVAGQADYYFILHKIAEDEEVMRGYLFLALKDSKTGEIRASFPEAEYRTGKPVDYRRGDRFAIRRFKEYKGVLQFANPPDILEVKVYSDTGDLLLNFRRRIQK